LRLIRILVVLVFSLVFLIPAAYAEPVDPLQVGDRGDEVQVVQEKLSQMGYVVGSMDGVYGDVTAEAVKAMQKDKKLTVDGKVGPELFKMLAGRDLPVSRGPSITAVRRLIQTSFQYVGVPYWFGGSSPRGFDCSGFTRYVFANNGIDLPRMADGQFGVGRPVSVERLQPGDLVFFETYEPGPSHVGIYIGNSQFISATSSRGVAVADLFGQYWGERYIGARRVL
jgi:peptidoglycan DL-endopeptidase CwlO